MAEPYENLDQLLSKNPKAKDFFEALPQERQHNIRQYQDSIHHDRDLRRFAEHLLSGGLD